MISLDAPKTTWPLNVALTATIVLAVFAVYSPAISGGFLWDDHVWLWDNVTTIADDGLLRCWVQPDEYDYWPLTASAFWLQYRLWGTDSTTGYHIVNIVLHALAALLIWRTLLRLKVPGAWLAGMLFAVHPVCVLSVAWISELKNTLSIVFFVLAILLYLRSEDSSKRPWSAPAVLWYIAAVLAFFLALTAKTSTIMLPVLLLGAAWWRRGKISVSDLLRSGPFFALSGIFAWTTVHFQYTRTIGVGQYLPQNFYQRICIAGQAFWTYLQTSLLPIRLPVIYPNWIIDETSLLQ